MSHIRPALENDHENLGISGYALLAEGLAF